MINYNEWINGDDCCHKHNDCGCTGSSGSCDCEYIMSSLAILSDDVNNVISGKADISAVTEIIDSLSGYVATSAITSSVTSASTDSEIPTAKAVYDALGSASGGISSGEVQTMIDESISGKVDTTDFSTHTADTNIHVTAQEKNTWNAKSNFSGSYNDLTDKPTIPTVPTDVSAFNNDAGYITSNDLAGYATEQWVLDKNYASSSSLSGKQDTLVSGVNIKTINNESLLGSGNITISGGSTITIDPSLDSGSTNAVANSAITNALNSKASQSDLSSLTDVVSAHTASTNIHVTAQDKINWNNKSNFSGSYNDLTDKPTIPTVPTSNTAFTNDAGYITSAALSGYAESSAVTQEISAAVSGKVDTSAFTAYSAATNTTISNKADSSALNNYLLKSKIWCGTQAEYDLIQNKDAETLYLIHS